MHPDRHAHRARAAWYAWTIFFVTLTTAAAWSARAVLALPDLVAFYLLAIMLVAFRFGRGPTLLGAGLSVLSYDVFFIEPVYTFRVSDPSHLLTFALMFVVGLVVTGLVRRLRHEEDAARAASLRARTEEIRSALLSAVSHDLRTPLASITGAGTSLRDDAGTMPPATRRELAETVCDEAARLDRLLVNLLDMTRLEASGFELRREWIPVDELVGTALGRVEERLHGRTLVTDLPADLPLAAVDPLLVEHALVNLVENALKHTPPGSDLMISARVHDGAIELDVADRGPGLPHGAERLFEKFERAAAPGVPGAGLGLAIVRGIARAHGGEVTAADRPGGGAVFTLRLPAREGPAS